MPNVDQFESAFRAAAKEVFSYKAVEIRKVLVVTDLEAGKAEAFSERAKRFLEVLDDSTQWTLASRDTFDTVGGLLDLVEQEAPDLICSYRNLRSRAWRWPYSLGVHLDVLTQVTPIPVMVFPHPRSDTGAGRVSEGTRVVMALTDHLTGDARLVNHAARYTGKDGVLILAHVEDQVVFDHYIETISKIPSIDTDSAREALFQQLLKEPKDYILSCREVLEGQNLPLRTDAVVTFGHRLREYRRLVEAHNVDLLVMNTKDEDQLAMHGLAYALAVEIRTLPLLLL